MNKTIKSALMGTLAAIIISAPAFAGISSEIIKICHSGGTGELSRAIASKQFSVKDRDSNGDTVLMLFAKQNFFAENINSLIGAGSDVNARNNDGQTPLMLAAAHNLNEEVTEALCAAGAKVNDADNGGVTALMFAAIRGTPEIFEKLLSYGADLFAMDNRQWTVLNYAEKSRNPQMLSVVQDAYRKKLRETTLRISGTPAANLKG